MRRLKSNHRKTQIALDFAISQAHKFSILWIRADKAENILADFKQISQLFIGSKDSLASRPPIEILRMTLSALEARSNDWFMVIDNADDLDLFRAISLDDICFGDFIPRSGRILITTRDSRIVGELAQADCGIQVKSMLPEEAKNLLAHSIPAELRQYIEKPHVLTDDDAARLAELLGYLPLAIAQAAANMRHFRMNLHEYLLTYQERERRSRLLEEPVRELRQAPQSVLLTWQISFERVQSSDITAAHILSYIAFFHWQSIPGVLLRGLPKIKALDDLDFAKSIGQLLSLSLIDVSNNDEYKVHPLVHQWASLRLKAEEKEEYIDPVLDQMAALFPEKLYEQKSLGQYLLPHAIELIEQASSMNIVSRPLARLLQTVAYFLKHVGISNWSIVFIEKSLKIAQEVWNADDISLIYIRKYYGRCLASAGQHSDAVAQFERCLQDLKKVNAPNDEIHSEDFYIRRDYSFSLNYTGASVDALEVVQRRLLEDEPLVVLPPGENQELSRMYLKQNLIISLIFQQKYGEARLHVAEISEWLRNNPSGDPNFDIAVMRDEGHILQGEHRYEEALAVYYHAWQRTMEQLDSQNKNFFVNASSVVEVLLQLRRYKEIVVLVDLVFEKVPENSLQGNALIRACGLLNYKGVTLVRLGSYVEAERAFATIANWEKILEASGCYEEQALSTYSSITVGLYNLGLSIALQGRLDEALEYRARQPEGFKLVEIKHGTLEARVARLETDNQLYKEAKKNLATATVQIGDAWWSENREALERAEDIHGPLKSSQEGSSRDAQDVGKVQTAI